MVQYVKSRPMLRSFEVESLAIVAEYQRSDTHRDLYYERKSGNAETVVPKPDRCSVDSWGRPNIRDANRKVAEAAVPV